ncbi:hypothetical protein MyNCGM683_21700 [Achromobacter xylosoxidans]
MKRKLDLRTVDPATIAHKNMLLSARIEDMSVSRLERGQRYIALAARLDAHECTAFVSLQQLIDYWLGDATLPAEQMDADIAREYVEDAFRTVGLPSPSPSLHWHGPKGMAQRQDYETPLFILKDGPFELFLPRLPDDFRMPEAEIRPDLPIDISWSLGALLLPAREVADLAEGDVIRLPARPGIARVVNTPVFSFFIHGDSMMINTIPDDAFNEFDDSDDYQDVTEDRAGQACVKVEDLPVTLSFFLSRRSMCAGEVSTLQSGMTIPLEHPVPYVDVIAGSIRVARGELVRIGQDLGVEIREVSPEPITQPGKITS